MIVEGGKLVYKQSNNLVHTTDGSKWIFVLSSSRILYVGEKKKGQFQHSSFLAGGATIASGRLVVQNGVLDVWYLFYIYIIHIHNLRDTIKMQLFFMRTCCRVIKSEIRVSQLDLL